MKQILLLLAVSMPGLTGLHAGTFSFSGNFAQDDDVQVFHYHVDNLGPVTISTASYNDTVVGFAPVLTLFSSDGTFRFQDEGFSGNREASLTWNSLPNQDYIVA